MTSHSPVLIAFLIVLAVSVPAFCQVKAYEEKMVMPTWEIGPAQVHSIFSDGTGRGNEIYPYTLNETLTDKKVDKAYNAVVLENEYVKIVVLPEVGGRLHGASDKTNGYTWLYWQKTVKPGLISMTGAWISGGIEWNFPHGHRPSGFMPVEHRLTRNPDGSATVWVGETEPIFRMRWLVGMTVFPGRSYVRCDYVFINPTDHKHSFQFWATAATHANEHAQAQYPGDMVTGHSKHEFWNWPVHNGVDLTWWKNVSNASSFFAFNNPSPWFGTYDHKAKGGMVHVGEPHIVQGKKLWTWGSGPSGRIWEQILSDGNTAYYEPQAGVWSDNQPDYHWMAPHEVKTAHDYWYPVRDTRGYHNADREFAVNTDLRDGKAFAGVYATSVQAGHKVVLKDTRTGKVLAETVTTIAPDKPYNAEVAADAGATVYDLHLAVYDGRGKLRMELQQKRPQTVELPPGQKDPGDPAAMGQDELYASGEWLDRFRRTEEALTYYRKALEKDPGDTRVNLEMGYLALKQGLWTNALEHLDRTLARDADSARAYFGKALANLALGKVDLAYDLFYRAIYNYDYHAPAYLNLARIDMMRGHYAAALDKIGEAEQQNAKFADIHALKAAVLRHMDRHTDALVAAQAAVKRDALHFMGLHEASLAMKNSGKPNATALALWKRVMRDAAQNYLELSCAYGAAGLYKDADGVLGAYANGKDAGRLNPMVSYMRGYYQERAGDAKSAAAFFATARKGPAAYTNPHRVEEMAALESAIRQDGADAQAHLFLGNLLYAKGRRAEGLKYWKQAVEKDSRLEPAWRNVGYAENRLNNNLSASREAYRKALELDPRDARVLLELDQVSERLGTPAAERLKVLMSHTEATASRDDLTFTQLDLRLAQGDEASLKSVYDTLKNRHFHSWEGAYGVHHAWVEVNQRLGDRSLAAKDMAAALRYYEQANEYPANLEVAPRTPDFRAHVNWNLAKFHAAAGDQQQSRAYLDKILAEKYSRPHLGTYYQAVASKAKGDQAGYRAALDRLEKQARELTSGKFEHRGDRENVGRYLLSLVLEEKGERAAAETERAAAMKANPRVARMAVQDAQIEYARAHQ
jgi:Tfp pilus assembly protein PilF